MKNRKDYGQEILINPEIRKHIQIQKEKQDYPVGNPSEWKNDTEAEDKYYLQQIEEREAQEIEKRKRQQIRRRKKIIIGGCILIGLIFLIYSISNSSYEKKCLEVCKNGLDKETSGSFYGKGYIYTLDNINERLTCLCRGEGAYNLILSNKTKKNARK